MIVAAATAVIGIVTVSGSGGSPSRGGLAHGRTQEWKAAVQTWLDRPLAGAGSGAYYQASLVHQGSSPSLYAHDLPLELAAELGVGGLLLGVRARRLPGRASPLNAAAPMSVIGLGVRAHCPAVGAWSTVGRESREPGVAGGQAGTVPFALSLVQLRDRRLVLPGL